MMSGDFVSPVGMIQQGDAMASSAQVIGGSEAGQVGAEDKDGLRRAGGHANRERSQMPNAIASRWEVERLMRGPKT